MDTYGEAARQLLAFLVERGLRTDVAHIKREHIETLVEHLLETRKPATASNRYRALSQLFAYAVVSERKDRCSGDYRYLLVLQRSRGTSDATSARASVETAKALSLENGTLWRLLDGNAKERGLDETRRRVTLRRRRGSGSVPCCHSSETTAPRKG